jgi:hypothetical protein
MAGPASGSNGADHDEIETLDDGDALELESGVGTPRPTSLHGTRDRRCGGGPGADADAGDRDAYLDQPGGDLRPDDPEDPKA